MAPSTIRIVWIPKDYPMCIRPHAHVWRGIASYYSESGCVGCSTDLTMANGERLDDDALTIAMPPDLVREHGLLNRFVTVTNLDTQMVTSAKVSDTGGFEKYARIADVTVAVKRSVRCTDLCNVEIREIGD